MQPEYLRMFLEEVKEEMRSRKMTQIALARRMGIKRGSISNAFTGRVNPSLKWIQRLVDALEMPVILCLGDKDE